jgi:hypothetical protein
VKRHNRHKVLPDKSIQKAKPKAQEESKKIFQFQVALALNANKNSYPPYIMFKD